jgi:cysteine synthase
VSARASLQHAINGLRPIVGNSPQLAIDCRFRGRKRTIWAKAEHFNVTGSIKDRMALYILGRAYSDGRPRPGA